MSEPLSDAVREAAEKEAQREFAHVEFSMTHPIAFMRGAVWVAGRLPSRDEIAEALHDALPENMNGTCYQWPARCVERDGPCVGLADAVLALIREHVTAT